MQIPNLAARNATCIGAGSRDAAALGSVEQALIITLGTALFESSNLVREHLNNNETERRELAKELRELKAKVKR